MKPMASGAIVENKIATPAGVPHYALTMPTSVVITGMESMEVLEQNLEIMKNFKPLKEAEVKPLLDRTRADGRGRRIREVQDQPRLRRHGASSRMVGVIAGIGQAG